ncbi:helix-turn-helix domain-containing protein [Roseovarius sp. SYSU LYC5161]|uniref:helix-turn-helix domain-containing protein n=1 Tax=Roseovarius halophilus (ex Wu et al. 2025) TaxID=3376060 RepID=UPI003999FFB0
MNTQTEITTTTATVPVLLTQEEAARIINKSPKWLERDRWAGPTVPYVKLGRSVRYRIADLLAYIEGNVQGAA